MAASSPQRWVATCICRRYNDWEITGIGTASAVWLFSLGRRLLQGGERRSQWEIWLMEHRSIPPSPQKITRQLIGVFPSFALLAALQLQLFTALGKQMLTCEELAVVMGVQRRRLFPVLNVLVLGELLQQTGDRYCNSEESA